MRQALFNPVAVETDFVQQHRAGAALMPGKLHETSFPELVLTVKDGKSLNGERECLNSGSILAVSALPSTVFAGQR